MELYLSSFKLGNNINYLKNWIKCNNNKILLIPNARDVRTDKEFEKKFINQDIKSLESLGFDVSILDLKDFFYDEEKLEQFITENDFHAFYAIGGNVFSLRKAMQLSAFDKFLDKVKNNKDFLYAGYSAGACILSPTLNGYEIVEKGKNPYNNEPIIKNGLNFVNYSIVPHYKSNHSSSHLIDEVIEYFKNNKIKYVTLRDGEVIIRKAIENSHNEQEDDFIK